MSILCTGSIAFDYLMSFPGYFRDQILPDRLESISLSFLVDNLDRQRGGIAPNIAYTMALLGDHPRLMATVGEDFTEYRAWLEERGIDTSLTKVIPGKYSASFFANTDLSNAQISSFYAGAMAHAAELSIHDVANDPPELVMISANDPAAMMKYGRECLEMGIPYGYDPSQQVVRMKGEELREGVLGAYSLFVNEYEFELLQKHTGLTADDILSRMHFAIITCGARGANVYSAGELYRIPVVPPKELVEPTGVGDAFRGGFLRGWRLGFGWQTCGQMGALAATCCIEQHGTQNHFYTTPEFVTRYRTYFDDQGELDALLTNQ